MATASKRVAAPAGVRRAYGELDRAQVVVALRELARRVGVQRVTMRELAAELGAAVPSVYYHVPGKQAALDLLAESVLDEIPRPGVRPWDGRLIELYCAAREVILGVPGVAGILQTSGGERTRAPARRASAAPCSPKRDWRRPSVAAAHAVLYTYLLGSVALEESRRLTAAARGETAGGRTLSGRTRGDHAGIKSSASGDDEAMNIPKPNLLGSLVVENQRHCGRPRCRGRAGSRHLRHRRPVRRVDPAAGRRHPCTRCNYPDCPERGC